MASTLPWQWVLESLAEVQELGTPILRALISRIPDRNLGDTVREKVALKYLDEYLACISDCSDSLGDSCASNERAFHPSERCENVVLRICKELGTLEKHGAELLKRDLAQFIHEKRACLPKSGLDRLKDTVLKGHHPASSSLQKRCGLVNEDHLHRSNVIIGEALESRGEMGDEDHQDEPLNLREQASSPCLKEAIDGDRVVNLSSSFANDFEEEIPEFSEHMEPTLINGGSKPETRKPHERIGPNHVDGNSDKFMEHNGTNPEQETHKADEDLELNHANGDSEPVTHKTDEQMPLTCVHEDFSYRNPVDLLSLGTDFSEQRSCLKCSEGGDMLVCGDCSVPVHEKCLGTSVDINCEGIFYCPHCSYRRATSAYKEARENAKKAKEKVTHARSALAAYMGNQKPPVGLSMKETQASVEARIGYSKKGYEGSLMALNHTSNENLRVAADADSTEKSHEGSFIAPKNRSNVEKLPCEGAERSHSDDGRDVLPKNGEGDIVGVLNKNGDNSVVGVPRESDEMDVNECGVSFKKGEREADIVYVPPQNGENDANVDGVSPKTSERDEDVIDSPPRDGERDDDCVPIPLGQQEPHVQPDKEPRPIKKRKRKMSPKSHAENEDQEPQSGGSGKRVLKQRSPPKRYTERIFPYIRRNKLPWTAEEEEVLEEGVNKFAEVGAKCIPWRRILDFGRHTFDKTRTPVDLKDKWRNIMKRR
ncbi:hypothetical protein AMTRI_Chr09g22460 [Amborella trichopoda]